MTTIHTPSVSGNAPALKFAGSDRFIRELRKRVDAYFVQTGQNKRDCPSMYFKTATIMLWFFGAYFLLLFAVHHRNQAVEHRAKALAIPNRRRARRRRGEIRRQRAVRLGNAGQVLVGGEDGADG